MLRTCFIVPTAIALSQSPIAAQTTVKMPSTTSSPPTVQSFRPRPTTEERIADLERRLNEAEELIASMQERLPEPGDHPVTFRRPNPTLRCSGFSASNPNDLLSRIHKHGDAGYQQNRQYENGTLMVIWTGCRSN